MITFAVGVLTSVVFWIGFFVLGLFFGTVLLKHMAPKTFKFVTKQKSSIWEYEVMDAPDYFFIFLVCIVLYGLWPVVLMLVILFHIIKFMLSTIFSNMVIGVAKLIPTIEFRRDK